MADRTSAGIFGRIFEYLAQKPDRRAKEFALEMWSEAGGYDFSWYQMECDDALVTLGLAKRAHDPEYPDEGKRVFYRDGDGWSP